MKEHMTQEQSIKNIRHVNLDTANMWIDAGSCTHYILTIKKTSSVSFEYVKKLLKQLKRVAHWNINKFDWYMYFVFRKNLTLPKQNYTNII
jgi:hypothetical protein